MVSGVVRVVVLDAFPISALLLIRVDTIVAVLILYHSSEGWVGT